MGYEKWWGTWTGVKKRNLKKGVTWRFNDNKGLQGSLMVRRGYKIQTREKLNIEGEVMVKENEWGIIIIFYFYFWKSMWSIIYMGEKPKMWYVEKCWVLYSPLREREKEREKKSPLILFLTKDDHQIQGDHTTRGEHMRTWGSSSLVSSTSYKVGISLVWLLYMYVLT